VKNCITWCRSTVTLCVVFNLVIRSLLPTDSSIVHKLPTRVFSTDYFRMWFYR
jgi:hypothetical protein